MAEHPQPSQEQGYTLKPAALTPPPPPPPPTTTTTTTTAATPTATEFVCAHCSARVHVAATESEAATRRPRPVYQTRTVTRGDSATRCCRCHALFHTKCLIVLRHGRPLEMPFECIDCIHSNTVVPRLTAAPVVQRDEKATEEEEAAAPRKRPEATMQENNDDVAIAKNQKKASPPPVKRLKTKANARPVDPLDAKSSVQASDPWSSDEFAILLKAVRVLPSTPKPTASQVADLFNTMAHQQQRRGRSVKDVADQAARSGLELLAIGGNDNAAAAAAAADGSSSASAAELQATRKTDKPRWTEAENTAMVKYLDSPRTMRKQNYQDFKAAMAVLKHPPPERNYVTFKLHLSQLRKRQATHTQPQQQQQERRGKAATDQECGSTTTGLTGGSLAAVIQAAVQADRLLRK